MSLQTTTTMPPRRLSFSSNIQSRMDSWKDTFQRQQQVIAFQLFLEPQAPTLAQLRDMADKLGQKLARLRGLPVDIPGDKREARIFQDVSDWSAALDVLVQDALLKKDSSDEARTFFEQVKLKDMNPVEKTKGGRKVQVPLWRIYRVGTKSIVMTFDHAIGDGLSLMSILALVATTRPDDGEGPSQALTLEETSPVIAAMCRATPWQRFVSRWGFLWLPNFLKCFKILNNMFSFPVNPVTPLFPLGMEETLKTKVCRKIPANYYGTVYLCPTPVSLLKSLARADERSLVTVNDVLITAIGETVRRYLKMVGYLGKGPIQFMTPLTIVKDPSTFLDEQAGLNNHYCPIGHELPLIGTNDISTSSFQGLLRPMHAKSQLIKTSCVVAFVYALIHCIFGRFVKPSTAGKSSKNGVGKAVFVWSNVPGPTMPIYIADNKVTEFQSVVSHPWCMMTTCSYNGMVYTTIQVDVRTTMESAKLNDAYMASLRSAITELLKGPEQDNAFRILEEAAPGHKAGPYLSPLEV